MLDDESAVTVAAGAIATDRTTAAAAAKLALPAWFAVMVHVPAALMVTVAAATVQTEFVDEVNVTGFPEGPPDAVSANVPPGTKVCGPGSVKLMTCAAGATAKVWVTSGAAL